MSLKLLALLSTLALASAKCPNDCSGHGTCNQYSACECYRNWMAADCSERVCYFGHAFVDTPQGDLNADGRTDIQSAAFHVVLGSNLSFFKNDDGTAAVGGGTGYTGRLADGTCKSKFAVDGLDYCVEDDVTEEYEKNVTDIYGFTDTCADKLNVAAGVDIKFSIAFEVTGAPQGEVGITLDAAHTCAEGASISADAEATDCTTATVVGVAGRTLTSGTNLSVILNHGKAIAVADNVFCDCAAIGAVDTDGVGNTTFPSEVAPQCGGFDKTTEDGGTASPCDGTETNFTGVLVSGGSDNALTAAEANRDLFVCDITAATYRVQWSNVNEWEAYPSDHGVAATGAKAVWDEGHFYRECSNKGSCNRASGVCECYAGYEGEGCSRSACPNDCSGHGLCKRAVDVNSSYNGWDAYKTQQCVCDGGYSGTDCSLRLCPYGDDPVTRINDVNEIQKFGVALAASITAGEGVATPATEAWFALEYENELNENFTTRAIDFLSSNVVQDVESALEALPNGNIEDVEVSLDVSSGRHVNVTFLHNSGNIPLLKARYSWHYIDSGNSPATFPSRNLPDGSFSSYGFTVTTTSDGNKENALCSNRGVCDYSSGLCRCFSGFTDFDCSVQNALATA